MSSTHPPRSSHAIWIVSIAVCAAVGVIGTTTFHPDRTRSNAAEIAIETVPARSASVDRARPVPLRTSPSALLDGEEFARLVETTTRTLPTPAEEPTSPSALLDGEEFARLVETAVDALTPEASLAAIDEHGARSTVDDRCEGAGR